jgi:hypothetical protein
VAALQHRVGSSAVRGGNVHPIGQADAKREEDGQEDSQAGTVVGRLEAILGSFDGCDHALGLSEISHRVGLPKSTVHRLANQLCAVGWLERNSGGYRVGLKLLELGSVALQRTGLRETAFKHLHSLALRTGLVVHLGILDHGEVVYLDRVTTTRVTLPTRVGGREPAYCTALGKVMLAFADPASQRPPDRHRLRQGRGLPGPGLRRVPHPQRRPGDRGRLGDRARHPDTSPLPRPRGTQHRPGHLVR